MDFPRIPNRYDTEEQRLKRLEAQEATSRRTALAQCISGAILIVTTFVLAHFGWGGAGVLLVPVGFGLMIAGGIQIFTAGSD
jgi:predicted phage tail protein